MTLTPDGRSFPLVEESPGVWMLNFDETTTYTFGNPEILATCRYTGFARVDFPGQRIEFSVTIDKNHATGSCRARLLGDAEMSFVNLPVDMIALGVEATLEQADTIENDWGINATLGFSGIMGSRSVIAHFLPPASAPLTRGSKRELVVFDDDPVGTSATFEAWVTQSAAAASTHVFKLSFIATAVEVPGFPGRPKNN